MADVRTRSDAIDAADSECFVGRMEELKSFRDELLRLPPHRLVFFISGQGGAGKTSLLSRYRDIAREQDFSVALSDEAQTDVPAVLGRFAEQLTQSGLKLPNFLERYKTYRQHRDAIEADPDAPQGLSALLGKTIVRAGFALGDAVPVVRKGLDLVDEDAVAAQASAWATYLVKKLSNRDDVALVKDPVPALSSVFFSDLNHATTHQRVLLCFDNFEQTRLFLDPWLLRLRDFNVSQNIRAAIASRTGPGPEWDSLRNIVSHMPIDVFSIEEANQFLDALRIQDARRRDEIISFSGRLPVMMSWLAFSDTDEPDAIAPTADIVDRFLRWVREPLLRHAALIAAVPRRFNLDILAAAIGKTPDDLHSEYAWLRQRPFVTQYKDGWRYHEVVRLYMLRHQRNESAASYRSVHHRLANYYNSLRQSITLPESEIWANQHWRQYTLEFAYHHLMSSPDLNWKDTLTLFTESLVKRRSLARELSDLLVSTPALEELSEVQRQDAALFVKSLRAIRDGSLKDGLPLFQRLCNMAELSGPAKSYALALRGEVLRKERRFDEALRDLNAAIEQNPEHGDALLSRGQLYRTTRRHQDALDDLRSAIRLNPSLRHMGLAEIGEVHQALRQHDEALQAFRDSIKETPRCRWCWFALTHEYSRGGHSNDELASLVLDAIQLEPTDTISRTHRAAALSGRGCHHAALTELDEILKIDGRNTDALLTKGKALHEIGRHDEAVQVLTEATELDDSTVAHAAQKEIGLILETLERYDEAAAALIRSLRAQPGCSECWDSLGRIYARLESVSDATERLYGALTVASPTPSFLAGRARGFLRIGSLPEAARDIEQALSISPKDDYAVYVSTMVFCALGRFDEALAAANRLIQLTPDSSRAYRVRANVETRLNRDVDALRDLQKMQELENDDDPSLLNEIGLCLSYVSRYDEALTYFERCLSQDPGNFSAAYNAAVCSVKSMGPAASRAHIQRAESMLTSKSSEGPQLYGFAGLAAVQGDSKSSIELLKQAISVDPTVLRWTRKDIAWEHLRSDPEFQALTVAKGNTSGSDEAEPE